MDHWLPGARRRGQDKEWQLTRKEQRGTCGGDENILYLVYSGVCMCVQMCENSSKYILTIGEVTVYKLHLKKMYFKIESHVSWSRDLNYRSSDGKRALKFSYFQLLI